MANPFANVVSNFRRGARETVFPEREAAKRQSAEFEAVRRALSNNPDLPPALKNVVQDPEAFAAVMKNPQSLTQLGQGAAALTPEAPKPQEGDDMLTLLSRAEQFEAQGDTRRAEILRNRARTIAGEEIPGQESGDEDGVFGNSLEGRALNHLLQFVPPEQRERALLEIAGQVAQRPSVAIDPITQQPVTRQITLPPALQQMLGIGQAGAQGTPTEGAGTPAESATAAPGTPAPGGDPAAALPSGPTIAEQIVAGNVAGPVPFVQRLAATVPFLNITPTEATDAATVAKDTTNALVEAFRRSPRFAEMDRRDLEKDFTITPRFFDTPQNALTEMAQIIGNVERRTREHQETLNEANITGEERGRRMDVLRQLREVRKQLGPPRASSTEEAIRLAESLSGGSKILVRNPDKPGNPWEIATVE